MDYINNLLGIPSELAPYGIRNLALMFFLFAFVGWVWEFFYIRVTEGTWALRGMMHGPWLPLYGLGGVGVIFILWPLRPYPLLVFVLSMAICTTLEYFTAVAIEHIFKCRWWDYTNKRIHFRARICLGGILFFGFSGALGVCLIGPLLDKLFSSIHPHLYAAVMIPLAVFFTIDLIWSAVKPNRGKSVTYPLLENYGKGYRKKYGRKKREDR